MRTIGVKGVSIGTGATANANRPHAIRVRYKNERYDYVRAYREFTITDHIALDAIRNNSATSVQRRIAVKRRSIRGIAGKDVATNLKRLEGYLERIFQQGFLSGLARYAPNNSGNLRNAGMFRLVVRVTPLGRSYSLEKPSKAHTTEKFRVALVITPNPDARGASAKDAYYTRLVEGYEHIRGLWTRYPDGVLRRVEYDKRRKRYYVKKRLKTRAFQFNRYRDGTVIEVPAGSVFTIGENKRSTRPAQPNNFLDLAGKEGLRRVERYLDAHGYFTMRVNPNNPRRIQESRLAGKAELRAIHMAPILSDKHEREYNIKYEWKFDNPYEEYIEREALEDDIRNYKSIKSYRQLVATIEYDRERRLATQIHGDDWDEPSTPF